MARSDLGPTIERRIAMVIGNSAYRHAGVLKNPVNDARAMARVLGRLGFEVIQGANLGLEGIGDALGEFESRLHERPDVALLYYAGHGLQVDGRNYLVPIDVQISQKTHLSTRAVLLSDILDEMAASASTTLLFLDAWQRPRVGGNRKRRHLRLDLKANTAVRGRRRRSRHDEQYDNLGSGATSGRRGLA